MDCNVIMDLLPLYADDCCSDESRRIVEEHIGSCKACKKAFDHMKKEVSGECCEFSVPQKISRISQFKASLVQSVALFVSFALIILGVTLESKTPVGLINGNWAYMIIVPATAFMMSLINWYFVRFYSNAKVFSWFCALFTFGFSIAGFAWAVVHYGAFSMWSLAGGFLALIFCLLSKVLSALYAKALGKI